MPYRRRLHTAPSMNRTEARKNGCNKLPENDGELDLGCCDGDGSCVDDLISNITGLDPRALADIFNNQAISLIEKRLRHRGIVRFEHSPRELRAFIIQNRSWSGCGLKWMCHQAPKTLLHTAVLVNRTEIIPVLLECALLPLLWDCRLQDVNSRYRDKTAIEIARLSNNREMRCVLEHQMASYNELTWMHKAALCGINEAMSLNYLKTHPDLLHQSSPVAEMPVDLPTGVQGHTGIQPVYCAVMSGCLPVVERLLSRGADVGHRSREGETLLTLAASLGHMHIVEVLVLKYNVPINQPGCNGKTSLQRAITNCDVTTMRKLIGLGAQVSKTSPLEAIATDNVQVFNTIFNHIYKRESAPESDIYMFLDYAKKNKCLPIVEYLQKVCAQYTSQIPVDQLQNRQHAQDAVLDTRTRRVLACMRARAYSDPNSYATRRQR